LLYGQPESSGFERGQSANTAADRDMSFAVDPEDANAWFAPSIDGVIMGTGGRKRGGGWQSQ